MSDDAPARDPYSVVLNDLRSQRDKIDNAIAAIEALRGGATPAPAGQEGQASPTPSGQALGAGAFLGLTIVDAAKKLLAHERRQLTNAEIVEKLGRGGLVLNSADKLNTVGSVLNRRFIQVGDVVRVGRGTWGLKEWYPNRSFKTKDDSPAVTSRQTGTEAASAALNAAAASSALALDDSASAAMSAVRGVESAAATAVSDMTSPPNKPWEF